MAAGPHSGYQGWTDARALTTGTVVAGAMTSNGSAMVQLSRLDQVTDRIPPIEICCLGVAAGMALAFGPG